MPSCPACGAAVDLGSPTCPRCGVIHTRVMEEKEVELRQEHPGRHGSLGSPLRWQRWGAAAAAVVGVGLLAWVLWGTGPETDPAAIQEGPLYSVELTVDNGTLKHLLPLPAGPVRIDVASDTTAEVCVGEENAVDAYVAGESRVILWCGEQGSSFEAELGEHPAMGLRCPESCTIQVTLWRIDALAGGT